MSDILGQLGDAADEAAKAEQPTARLEWSGNQGELSTGAVDASFDPSDLTGVFEKIGRKFGLNPEVDRLELCAGTLWEQRSRNRETDEFETVMLYAYRYKVVKSSLPVHLPARPSIPRHLLGTHSRGTMGNPRVRTSRTGAS